MRVPSGPWQPTLLFVCNSTPRRHYPFGLRGVPFQEDAVKKWLQSPTVLLLGEFDTHPRTRPLSNGPVARTQGPHVFARGRRFFQGALLVAQEQKVSLAWKLKVVQNIGHSNFHMASHAVKYLLALSLRSPSPLVHSNHG